jgi:hypothetical protein
MSDIEKTDLKKTKCERIPEKITKLQLNRLQVTAS